MAALVSSLCTTSLIDRLCVFPVPHSKNRYRLSKCSGTIPRARATCTVHIYSTKSAEGLRRTENSPRYYYRCITGRGSEIVLPKNFFGEVPLFISALEVEVETAQVFISDFKRRNEGEDPPRNPYT